MLLMLPVLLTSEPYMTWIKVALHWLLRCQPGWIPCWPSLVESRVPSDLLRTLRGARKLALADASWPRLRLHEVLPACLLVFLWPDVLFASLACMLALSIDVLRVAQYLWVARVLRRAWPPWPLQMTCRIVFVGLLRLLALRSRLLLRCPSLPSRRHMWMLALHLIGQRRTTKVEAPVREADPEGELVPLEPFFDRIDGAAGLQPTRCDVPSEPRGPPRPLPVCTTTEAGTDWEDLDMPYSPGSSDSSEIDRRALLTT